MMLSLNDFLTQILQPYFFYSLVFLSLSFVCIKVFLKFNPLISRRIQSTIWLIPLFIPISVMIFFYPQTLISMGIPKLPPEISVSASATTTSVNIIGFASISVFSITGLLCLGGAIAATGYLILTIVFGQRIAMKAFHVTMMYPEEYVSLQEKVKEISQKIGTPAPKVGIIDDLRPNAFTMGYGKNAVIVFSLGILKMLNIDELTAVVSHELAHVKSRDYLFRSISYTMNILSFFNPLSYFAASSAQKERELLADEKGAALLSEPRVMSDALAKLETVLQTFPKERFANRLSASLFLVSPLSRRSEILSAHPQMAHRVHNIAMHASKTTSKPINRGTIMALSLILIIAASAVGYGVICLQTSFFLQKSNLITVRTDGPVVGAMGPTGYVVGSGTNLSLPPGPLQAPNFGELPSQGNSQLIQGGRVVILNSSEPDYLP
jgi:heat shock protein HtpX